MRYYLAILVALTAVFTVPAVGQQPKPPAEGNQLDAKGYVFGLSVGAQMRTMGFQKGDIDLQSLLRGLEAGLTGADSQLSEEQMQQAGAELDQMMQARAAKQNETAQAMAVANDEKSKLFLEENKKKEGVQVLPSGLQYQVVKAGTGPSPKASDTVRVHYTGRLINGKVFDSSVERGEPAEFQVGQVIPGWQEALQKMKVGGKWKLFIPPNLAYGARGTPTPPGQEPAIGPNEALIFDVELLDIVQ